MKFNLAEIRKMVESKKGGTIDDTFFAPSRLTDDTDVLLRFLPMIDVPLWSVERLYHELPGDDSHKKYTCPKTNGDPCPVCEKSQKYYNEENKPMGSMYYRKKTYYANVIVYKNENVSNWSKLEIPTVYTYGVKIQEKLEHGLDDNDIGVFFDPEYGTNFKLNKRTTIDKDKKWPNYDLSEFVRKSTNAFTSKDEEAEIMGKRKNLNAMLPDALSYEALEALLSGTSPVVKSPLPPKLQEATKEVAESVPEVAKLAEVSTPEPDDENSGPSKDTNEDDEIAALLRDIQSHNK